MLKEILAEFDLVELVFDLRSFVSFGIDLVVSNPLTTILYSHLHSGFCAGLAAHGFLPIWVSVYKI